MTMLSLYVKEDTYERLYALVGEKIVSIREANVIEEYKGVTADNILNWLIETARKYYKLGDPNVSE